MHENGGCACSRPGLVHANLGNMLYGERDFAGSVESYRRAIALLARRHRRLRVPRHALKECADADSAIDCYRKVLAIRPDDANVHLSLGDALLAQAISTARSQACALRID
jgi:tetratricopeptide (TPR) repeat protein